MLSMAPFFWILATVPEWRVGGITSASCDRRAGRGIDLRGRIGSLLSDRSLAGPRRNNDCPYPDARATGVDAVPGGRATGVEPVPDRPATSGNSVPIT